MGDRILKVSIAELSTVRIHLPDGTTRELPAAKLATLAPQLSSDSEVIRQLQNLGESLSFLAQHHAMIEFPVKLPTP